MSAASATRRDWHRAVGRNLTAVALQVAESEGQAKATPVAAAAAGAASTSKLLKTRSVPGMDKARAPVASIASGLAGSLPSLRPVTG